MVLSFSESLHFINSNSFSAFTLKLLRENLSFDQILLKINYTSVPALVQLQSIKYRYYINKSV